MAYAEAKIYFDGSHFIAIPHTERPIKKRPKPIEDIITVIQEEEMDEGSITEEAIEPSVSLEENSNENNGKEKQVVKEKKERKMTHKELFEELYQKNIDLTRKAQKKAICEGMLPYFNKREDCEIFVATNIDRKIRNLICRKVRMVRKANLAGFNYFCTFTYDNNLHNETSFKKKLKKCLENFATRKGWKYMGVWERAPETKRLHFHGLFYIPENTLSGEIIVIKDYNFREHKLKQIFQSTFFCKKFGRNDFEEIDIYEKRLGNAIAYLMKYIEKTGEKIVFSKGLPQYFVSDIIDDDVVTTIGQEDKKLLLFDNFRCWDEGVLVGTVCQEVIEQMRKCN